MIDLPPGPFDIIYADPPWSYSGDGLWDPSKVGGKRVPVHSSAVRNYETMHVRDIAAMPVGDIAADDSLLFIWVTSPCLPEGLAVLSAWGFKYATVAFVWDKERINPGYYTLSQCELCLVAKRGRIPRPRGARNIRQLHHEKRTIHSRKPDEIAHRIEQMFPEQRKIELFARRPRDGWAVWGNEV